jgi:hypothetical protein
VPLICRLGTLEANAAIEVVGERKLVGVLEPDDGEFMAHPPVRVPGVGIHSGGYIRDNELMLNKNELRIGDYASDGILGKSRIRRGSRIIRIGGRDISTLSAGEIRDLLARNPIVEGTSLEYMDPDGNLGKVRLGEQVGIVQEVKVVDVRPLNLSADDFNAEILVDLLQEGEYRVVNDKGEPMSAWKMLPAGPGSISTETKVTREESLDHNYKLFVERKRGEAVRKYEFQFKLKPEAP